MQRGPNKANIQSHQRATKEDEDIILPVARASLVWTSEMCGGQQRLRRSQKSFVRFVCLSLGRSICPSQATFPLAADLTNDGGREGDGKAAGGGDRLSILRGPCHNRRAVGHPKAIRDSGLNSKELSPKW